MVFLSCGELRAGQSLRFGLSSGESAIFATRRPEKKSAEKASILAPRPHRDPKTARGFAGGKPGRVLDV